MLVISLAFGIVAAIIAGFKGFKSLRWLLALGLLGLIVVICLSSATKYGLSPEEAAARAARANKLGAIMAWINIGLSAIIVLIALG